MNKARTTEKTNHESTKLLFDFNVIKKKNKFFFHFHNNVKNVFWFFLIHLFADTLVSRNTRYLV